MKALSNLSSLFKTGAMTLGTSAILIAAPTSMAMTHSQSHGQSHHAGAGFQTSARANGPNIKTAAATNNMGNINLNATKDNMTTSGSVASAQKALQAYRQVVFGLVWNYLNSYKNNF